MQIGYPCSNLSLGCSAARTFRLASYSSARLIETVTANLDCLEAILRWNAEHGIRYFRISSGTIPFASHPVMDVAWQEVFAPRLAEIGALIHAEGMRLTTHPGQYTLLNSPRAEVVEASMRELAYHAELFGLLGLDGTHKIQIHVGGVYGDRDAARETFIARVPALPEIVRRRLVIENDERQFSLADCLAIAERTGIPVLFDWFHHSLFNHGEAPAAALDAFMATWDPAGDGVPMMDFSTQDATKQAGAHASSIDTDAFIAFLDALAGRNVDVMLEIKDKEASALAANAILVARTAPV
jgi:UV DNA damage endonuclease